MTIDTDTLMLNARKMRLLADEYRLLQDMMIDNNGYKLIGWRISDLRVMMMRLSADMQQMALEQTLNEVRQQELDYSASDGGASLEHPDHANTLEPIGIYRS